ncbi:MAG: hypothetical protein H7311_04940 [Ramlibacter sp.]|nr:hypothetical protein [Cryobacterium sp.]
MFGNADANLPTVAVGVPAGSASDHIELQAPAPRSQNNDAATNAQTMTDWLADLPSQSWDAGDE